MARYYPGIRQLLLEMKGAGSYARLLDDLDHCVSERQLIDWCKGVATIHDGNIDTIERIAREKGLDPAHYKDVAPMWDFSKSYEENLRADVPEPLSASHPKEHLQTSFLGRVLNSPVGAAPTVVTSSAARVEFLLSAGLDLAVYKTVRSRAYEADPKPNIYACRQAPTLDPDNPSVPEIMVTDVEETKDLSVLVNRFGAPSREPEEWQADFRNTKARVSAGQVLILSVMGTADKNDSVDAFVRDWVTVVELAIDAGADVIELNLSCPNTSGREGEVFRDVGLTKRICAAVRAATTTEKLLLKIGYMPRRELEAFVLETAELVDGYTAINSVSVRPFVERQNRRIPAFPGGSTAGLTGKPILKYALRAVKVLNDIRRDEKLTRKWIIGCGGVTEPQDVTAFISNGADVVLIGSRLFSEPRFGLRVRRYLENQPPLPLRTAVPFDVAHLNWSHAVDGLPTVKDSGHALQVAMRVLVQWHSQHLEQDGRAFRSERSRTQGGIPTVAEFKRLILDAVSKAGIRL